MKRLRGFVNKITPGLKKATGSYSEAEFQAVKSALEEEFYLSRYPDVAASGVDPVAHYLDFGHQEGRWPTEWFDTSFYAGAYPEVARFPGTPFYHYILEGRDKGYLCKSPVEFGRAEVDEFVLNSVKQEFEADYYLQRYPDVAESGMDPLVHYLSYGWKEHRDPSPMFSTSSYLKHHADVAESGVEPFFHYVVSGHKEGRYVAPATESADDQSDWVIDLIRDEFDEDYYRQTNANIITAQKDPIRHYVRIGWKKGSDPHPDFNVEYYLSAYKDIAAAGIEPFSHYLSRGKDEGRKGSGPQVENEPQPSDEYTWQREAIADLFDADFYVANYADVASSDVSPIDHYLHSGWKEGRNPSNWFDTKFYLSANPDVDGSGINPLVHFAVAGKLEGRLGKHPGGYKADVLRQQRSVAETVELWRQPKSEYVTPVSDLTNRLTKQLHAGAQTRVVFSLSHDQYKENTGGIQSCIDEEQHLLAAAGAVYVHLSPYQPLPVLADKPNADSLTRVVVNGEEVGRFPSLELVESLRRSIDLQNVDLVIHALHGHNVDWVVGLYRAIAAKNAYFWLHDYFSLCLGYNLLRNGVSYCHAPDVNSAGCQLCVYGELRAAHQIQMKRLFDEIPFHVISPSEFSLHLWKSKATLPFRSARVHQHRQLVANSKKERDRSKLGPFRVAFLGHPAAHKGWHAFRDLVTSCKDDPRYSFYHLGLSPDSSLPIHFVEVRVSEHQPAAMVRALEKHDIDLVLILSNWPETFCLTAYEALAAGALVVTTCESGNVADMLKNQPYGMVLQSEAEIQAKFHDGAIADRLREYQKDGTVSLSELQSSGITAGLITNQTAPTLS